MDELQKLKLEQLRRFEKETHKHYVPTGKNEEFIKMVGDMDTYISMFSAANGVGKTYVGAQILANLIWRVDNPWFDYKMFRDKWTFPKKIRIITEPQTLKETMLPTLREVFPTGRFKESKEGKTYTSYIVTDNGWEIYLMSYEQAPKEFESSTIGFVWFDEPPPQPIYTANVSRLRKGGQMMITATPLAGSAWMYDHIICNAEHGAGKRDYVNADVESACIEHGVRGYLKHSDIERMLSEYDEDELHARAKGLFAHLTGLIYKQWDRKVHIIEPFVVSLKDYCVFQMIDPHPRTEDAILWVAFDKYGQYFVVDELFINVDGTEQLASRIKKKDDEYRVTRRLADPCAFVEDQHTGRSLATELSDYGLQYLPASKARSTSNRRIGTALNFQRRGDEMIVTPELYVFATCLRTIWEIEHWRWSEWKGKSGDEKNRKNVPVDKDDHMIENLGRCLVQEPNFEIYVPAKPWFAGQTMQDEGEGVLGSGDDPYF